MSNIHNQQLNDDTDEMLLALVYIDNLKDMQNYVNDLLTNRELKTTALRWKAARMLHAGLPYTKIVKLTGMSSATVARLSQVLKRRSGGFSNMLKEMGA